jgi:GAF domain-containing protein/HAMP domain-containing protein
MKKSSSSIARPVIAQSSPFTEIPFSESSKNPDKILLIIRMIVAFELSLASLSIFRATNLADWHLYTVGIIFIFCSILVLVSSRFFKRGQNVTGLFILMCATHISLLAPSILFSGKALFLSLAIVLLTLIEVSGSQVATHRTGFIIGGLSTGYIASILDVIPFNAINLQKFDLPNLRFAAISLLVILIMMFIFLILKRIINLDLRIKLVTSVIFFTMAPLVALVAIDSQFPSVIISSVGFLSALGAVLMTDLITKPIDELISTVHKITIGDLEARATVNTRDEIQILAQSINHMAGQLHSFINGLEDNVQERTLELTQQTHQMGYRVAQLQTLSEVARSITSVTDLEQLLFSVTRITSERFNFYHVGIFLVDENSEYADLRAANSEGGKRMLARQHRLRIGQTGIVGYVAASGEPRIATDVGSDAVYFHNPDLPDTRSEMALPLKSGGKCIGVIDVQSTSENAFTEDDIRLFSALADQVSIAIDNNRLYMEIRQALLEAENVHRKYLHQEWNRELRKHKTPVYEYSVKGITPLSMNDSPEVSAVLETGVICKLPNIPQNGSGVMVMAALAVPVKLRGEIIGVIDIQEVETNHAWTQDEINMVKQVADQVGIALENARLFEQTAHRAERERKVNEITGKIRSTMDTEVMLKTAVAELQLALKAKQAQIMLKPKLLSEISTKAENANGSPEMSVR